MASNNSFVSFIAERKGSQSELRMKKTIIRAATSGTSRGFSFLSLITFKNIRILYWVGRAAEFGTHRNSHLREVRGGRKLRNVCNMNKL